MAGATQRLNKRSLGQRSRPGDVVQVTSGNGTVKNRYEYDTFGETTLEIEEAENSIKYAGVFQDSSTGLYYLRARYYDAAIGRFISEDSYRGEANNPASLNLYTYCLNDPIQFIDPSGHSEKSAQERSDMVQSAYNAYLGGYISWWDDSEGKHNLMRDVSLHNSEVTANDVEMMWQAYWENKGQHFTNSNRDRISDAIREPTK